MDAYSYLARGKVFANAQTGNILLFGVNLADGDVDRALHYAVPVIAFAVGIALAHSIKIISKERRLHWRQAALQEAPRQRFCHHHVHWQPAQWHPEAR